MKYFTNITNLDDLKKAYRAYVKSHPGIIAYLEIEKSQWER